MGVPKLKTKTSVEDYLDAEKISPVKHEFVEGEVYAMAGTSDRHNLIAGDLFGMLLVHLRATRNEANASADQHRAIAALRRRCTEHLEREHPNAAGLF